VTFLPKWHHKRVGSRPMCISRCRRGRPSVFYEPGAIRHVRVDAAYLAGLIEYAPEYTYFLAPYVNSYKRFMKGTFAPTRTVWSVDNRTAASGCAASTPSAAHRVPHSAVRT
jgi:glutamine synthetase